MLQEAKLDSFSNMIAVSFSSRYYNDWVCLKANGSAGRMCIGWNSDQFEKLDEYIGIYFITVKLINLQNDIFFLSSVYGLSYYNTRNDY